MTERAAGSRSVWAGWFLAPGAVVAGLLLWRMFCTIERVQWNAPRLAPSFALAAGLNIYGTQNSGPFLGWIYGPVFPIYLLPATLFSDLNFAFAVAWILNLAAFFLPAWLVARSVLREGPAVIAALFFWAALSLAAEVSNTQFYYLHVDTLCVGLILVAAWAAVAAVKAPDSTRWIQLAALAAALALWTKQSAVAVPMVLALWLWKSGEVRLARRLVLWTTVYAGALGLAFLAWFGPRQLWFNLVVFHLHNPFRPEGNPAFFLQLASSAPAWLFGVVGLWLVRRGTEQNSSTRCPLENLLCWLALGNLPLGVLAATKVAGGWNSLHSLNFALLALSLALARQLFSAAQSWMRLAAAIVACAGPLICGWLAADAADLRWTPGTMQATDLDYARQHRGRLYLPWNPLLTVITDRKLYPFDDALLCLARAGLDPSPESVRRDIPHGALIVYPEPAQSQVALNYLGRNSPPPPSGP